MKSFRRWSILLLTLALAVLGLWRWQSHRATRSVLARLQARGLPTNPQELDRFYRRPPSDQNLALPLLKAAASVQLRLNRTNTPYHGRGTRAATDHLPPHPADPALLATWRAELDRHTEVFAALEEARGTTLARYPVNLAQGFNALLPHLAQLKSLGQFLAFASLVEAESGHSHEAADRLRQLLTVARSLESEPILVSQMVRSALLQLATTATAENLPRTQVSAADWEALQGDFTRALQTNTYQVGLVGELSLVHGYFSANPAQILAGGPAPGGPPTPPPIGAQIGGFLYVASGIRQADAAFGLARLTDMIEAADLPFPAALVRSREIQEVLDRESRKPLRGLKLLSLSLLPALQSGLERSAELEARLRLAIVGCALERHRLAHGGKLPPSLDALLPTYLPAVPLDPFDGQPLRYRPTPTGYVLYSVGPDGRDNQGEGQEARGSQRSRAEHDLPFTVTHH